MIGEKTLLHFKWYALKFIVGYALEKHESKQHCFQIQDNAT
jgi:hypothetical protein